MQRFADQAFDLQHRGKFKQAIAVYDKAILKATSVQLLDRRAECHVLLGNHEAALKDAKASIQHASTDPVGYLRAGKILQSMGKDEVALQVLSTGLRRVKHAGKVYEDLRKEHKTLADKLSPNKSIDPLTLLPRELALMVLNYLEFHRIVSAMRVSKGWSRFIASCPELWHHLDFITVPAKRTKVKTSAVKRYVNIARKNVIQLSINNMYDFEDCFELILQRCSIEDIMIGREITILDEDLVDMILKHCPALRRLNLSSSVKPGSIHTMFTLLSGLVQSAEEICIKPAHAVPDLAQLEFPRLRLLSLSPGGYIAWGDGFLTLPKMPNVESLILRGPVRNVINQFDDLKKLSHLSFITDIDVLPEVKLPGCIRSLEVSLHIGRVEHHGGVHRSLRLPLLQALQVDGWRATLGSFLGTFVHASDAVQDRLHLDTTSDTVSSSSSIVPLPLTQLKLFDCNFLHDTSVGLEPLLTHDRLKSMETLVIYHVSPWNDDHMAMVAKHMPKLRSFRVANASVTGVGVKAVLDACPHLKSFEVSTCNLAPDAIAWARSKGVKVNNRTDKA